MPSGVTAKELEMNLIQTTAKSSVLAQSLFALIVGVTLVFASGFAHSQTLHDTAHDMRHSTGFPCH